MEGPHDAFHDLSCAGSEDPQYVHRLPLHDAIIDASCQLLKDGALADTVTPLSVQDAEFHYPSSVLTTWLSTPESGTLAAMSASITRVSGSVDSATSVNTRVL